ncbi:MAG TPA: PAS domain S-box protein [Gemmatimonadales bacterium]|nr:PAS domain S-box protein [Gemmatimonadales bacterium]
MTSDSAGATELRLRAAVESSPSGILMTDARGSIVLVNREVERLFGYSREELLGRSVETLVPERFRTGHAGFRGGFMGDPKVRAMGAGRELFGLRKDGVEVPVEIGLTPVATAEGMFILASIVDISARKTAEAERRRLEDELQQAQKLEAIGTLAGGIAHDFNNVLFGIVGYAELIGKARRPEEAAADLAELLKAAARGRDLVDRILIFSRRQPAERQSLELGRTVEEAAKLLRATLPPAIDLRLNVHPQAPRILGDPTSIHQVLMNLGTNAAHAMPAGGALEITVEPRYLRDSVVRLHPGLHEGPYGVLVVRDTGIGMDRAVLERALEPFFTTKPKGSGTGLGLSMVHSIVKAHEGALDLESTPGRGTTVTCYFPALQPSPAEERFGTREPPVGRGERVLLVEDEPSLARMNERRLQSLGYHVTVETDALHALKTFAAQPSDFDVMLSDHLMPGMVGLDLARAVHNLRPDLPILLLTGFIEELPEEMLRTAGVRRLIGKPTTLLELGEAVREVLG